MAIAIRSILLIWVICCLKSPFVVSNPTVRHAHSTDGTTAAIGVSTAITPNYRRRNPHPTKSTKPWSQVGDLPLPPGYSSESYDDDDEITHSQHDPIENDDNNDENIHSHHNPPYRNSDIQMEQLVPHTFPSAVRSSKENQHSHRHSHHHHPSTNRDTDHHAVTETQADVHIKSEVLKPREDMKDTHVDKQDSGRSSQGRTELSITLPILLNMYWILWNVFS